MVAKRHCSCAWVCRLIKGGLGNSAAYRTGPRPHGYIDYLATYPNNNNNKSFTHHKLSLWWKKFISVTNINCISCYRPYSQEHTAMLFGVTHNVNYVYRGDVEDRTGLFISFSRMACNKLRHSVKNQENLLHIFKISTLPHESRNWRMKVRHHSLT